MHEPALPLRETASHRCGFKYVARTCNTAFGRAFTVRDQSSWRVLTTDAKPRRCQDCISQEGLSGGVASAGSQRLSAVGLGMLDFSQTSGDDARTELVLLVRRMTLTMLASCATYFFSPRLGACSSILAASGVFEWFHSPSSAGWTRDFLRTPIEKLNGAAWLNDGCRSDFAGFGLDSEPKAT